MPLKFYQNVTLKTQLFWLIGPYAKEASVIWISFFFFTFVVFALFSVLVMLSSSLLFS